MSLCENCGADLEVEKEVFSQDRLFTGHSCKGEEDMNCEHCEIEKCPVLNKPECPINKLWERAREAQEAVAEAEWIIREG